MMFDSSRTSEMLTLSVLLAEDDSPVGKDKKIKT